MSLYNSIVNNFGVFALAAVANIFLVYELYYFSQNGHIVLQRKFIHTGVEANVVILGLVLFSVVSSYGFIRAVLKDKENE